MKIIFLVFTVAVLVFAACRQNKGVDSEQLKKEIWETVIAHNDAWSFDENMEEQMKYVHPNIVGVFPPFLEMKKGKEAYKAGYREWYDHATVHFFNEINPDITIYNGTFAIVIYNIEMSFDYDGELIENWKGMDCLTLIKDNSKWLITSDMYAKRTRESI